MGRVVIAVAVLGLVCSGACISPVLPGGHFSCGEADCPQGMICASDGLCYWSPPGDANAELDDGALPGDAGTGLDGCVAATNQELCGSSAVECGPLAVVDNCGTARDVFECGPCVDTHYCAAGSCSPCSFAWRTGSWSACSAECGGGSQTRSVWCECSGTSVADSHCPAGSKPATSQSCNTQACCTCVAHDACGDDGCGNSCGTCAGERWCGWGAYCLLSPASDGSTTCDAICAGGGSVCLGTCLVQGSDCHPDYLDSCSAAGINGLYCYCW